jgi:N-acetylmuramoyl-L-alanine amidase
VSLLSRTALVMLLVLLGLQPLQAAVRLQMSGVGPDSSLPSVRRDGGQSVPAGYLLRVLGFKTQWDAKAEKLVATRDSSAIQFIEDNPFYQVNGELFQMPVVPFRNGGLLYLRASTLVEILAGRFALPLSWDEDTRVITRAASQPKKKPVVQADEDTVKESPPAVAPAAPASKAPPSRPVALPDGQKGWTLVLDPGHGGKDPGAIGPNGLQEKDVVLAIALGVRDLLKKNPEIKVYLTRDADRFIPLSQRTKFANDKNADLFLSVHANSIGGTSKKRTQTQGYKIYFLSQEKNEEDKLVAMRENSVIQLEEAKDRGNYLQNILIDMAGNEYMSESQDFSILIDKAFEKGLEELNKLHTGIGQARFYVLNGAYMPSVLIETAFISNPYEERLLQTEKFQKRFSKAIYDAILTFRKKYEASL